MRLQNQTVTQLIFSGLLFATVVLGCLSSASAQSRVRFVSDSNQTSQMAQTPQSQVQPRLNPVVDQQVFRAQPTMRYAGPLGQPRVASAPVPMPRRMVVSAPQNGIRQVEQAAYQSTQVQSSPQISRRRGQRLDAHFTGYAVSPGASEYTERPVYVPAPPIVMQQGVDSVMVGQETGYVSDESLPDTYASGYPRSNFFGIAPEDYCDEWEDFCECNSCCDDCAECSCGGHVAHCFRKFFRCCPDDCQRFACHSCKLRRKSKCGSSCSDCESGCSSCTTGHKLGARLHGLKYIFSRDVVTVENVTDVNFATERVANAHATQLGAGKK